MKNSIVRWVAVIALLAFYHVWAQADDKQEKHKFVNIEYCTSYEDMAANRWQHADSVEVITKSRINQVWWGGMDFKFKSKDKQLKKTLREETFAIMHDGTLLLNVRNLKDRGFLFGNGYVQAFRMTDGRIIFLYLNANKGNREAAYFMFGLAGVFATTAAINTQDVCYILMPGDNDVTFVDEQVMGTLLYGFPDLLAEYEKVKGKQKVSAAIILPLLQKAKLIQVKEEE